MKKVRSLLVKTVITGISAASVATPFLYNSHTALASTGGLTATDAINWVKSKVGHGIDYDGCYGAQCVDLAKAYYAHLKQSPSFGNGSGYTSNALPSGWKRYKGASPKKGDILVYTGGYGGYGHVAIYESDYSTYHQNWNSHSYVERVTYKYNASSSIKYWGVIRPDFAPEKNSGGTTTTKTTTAAPKNGLVKENGVWKYYTNGKVNTSFQGLVKYKNNWYYVRKGKIDFNYTGMGRTITTKRWYYVKKGKINFSYTGLAKNPENNKLYYMKKGKFDTSYNGNVKYNGKIYIVRKGCATLKK